MMVRRAVPGDEHEVAQVHVDSWQAAYRGLLPDDVLDGLDPTARARRYTFADRGADVAVSTTVAVGAGRIRGFVTIGPGRDDDANPALVGELYALYVSPSWWGGGLGRSLIDAGRDSLVEHGYTEALLWVLAGNGRAARF